MWLKLKAREQYLMLGAESSKAKRDLTLVSEEASLVTLVQITASE